MNDTINTIRNRRSIRGYKPEQISKEALEAILDCGMCAPSAMNTQNWHFTVIQNADLLKRISDDAKSMLPETSLANLLARNNGDESRTLYYNAPTLIVASGKSDDKWSIINCSLAMENMSLAAESLGIGSCIIGMVKPLFEARKDEYVKILEIPNGYTPFYAVCFGYKEVESPAPERAQGKVSFIS